MELTSKADSEDTRAPGGTMITSNTNLLVKSIRADVMLEQFRAAFKKFGNITSAVLKERTVKLPGDQTTPAKFGFVNFETKEEADNAFTNGPNDQDVNALIDKRIIGSEVFIFFHQKKTERTQEMMMKKMFPGEDISEENFEKFLGMFHAFMQQQFGDAVNDPAFMDAMTESIKNGAYANMDFAGEMNLGEDFSQSQMHSRIQSSFDPRNQSSHASTINSTGTGGNVQVQRNNANPRGAKPNANAQGAHPGGMQPKPYQSSGVAHPGNEMRHPNMMNGPNSHYGSGYPGPMGRPGGPYLPGSPMQSGPGASHGPPHYMMGGPDPRHHYGPSHPQGPGNIYPHQQGVMSSPNGMMGGKYPAPGPVSPIPGKVPVVHQQGPPTGPHGQPNMNPQHPGPQNGKQSANSKQGNNRGQNAGPVPVNPQGQPGFRPPTGPQQMSRPPGPIPPGPMPPNRPQSQQGPFPGGQNYPPGARGGPPGVGPGGYGGHPGPAAGYMPPNGAQARKPPGPMPPQGFQNSPHPGVHPPGSYPPHQGVPQNQMDGNPQGPRGNPQGGQMMPNGGRQAPHGYPGGQGPQMRPQQNQYPVSSAQRDRNPPPGSNNQNRNGFQPDVNWILKNKEKFEEMDTRQQEAILTQLLYPLVNKLVGHSELANKVTTILVDSEIYKLPEILDLFKNPQELKTRVDEAVQLVDTNNN